MPLRQTSGSVVCPNCGRLVGVQDAKCFNCGRAVPGLWGYGPALGRLSQNVDLAGIMIGGCVLMFLVSIALDLSALGQSRGLLSFLSPGTPEMLLLGASGAWPIFTADRWWTVLSAAWLHGGILHIAFNLYWLRGLWKPSSEIFGPGRTMIIYTAGSVLGFAGTSLMFFVLPFPFLQGAGMSLGASASLCGLGGGLFAYAQKSGNRSMEDYLKRFALFILIFGVAIGFLSGGRGGVDNWAHIFGALGGYLAARLMRPLEDESPVHLVGALICFLAFVLAIAASVIHGLPLYRAGDFG